MMRRLSRKKTAESEPLNAVYVWKSWEGYYVKDVVPRALQILAKPTDKAAQVVSQLVHAPKRSDFGSVRHSVPTFADSTSSWHSTSASSQAFPGFSPSALRLPSPEPIPSDATLHRPDERPEVAAQETQPGHRPPHLQVPSLEAGHLGRVFNSQVRRPI